MAIFLGLLLGEKVREYPHKIWPDMIQYLHFSPENLNKRG